MRLEKPENDLKHDIWWNVFRHRTKLMHGQYSLGEITFVETAWQAKPFWYEQSQLFKTEEEAKSWLAAMYRLR